MSRLSTSNSKPTGWNRVWREVLRVFLLLLALEILVRVGPIHAFLSQRLDPYENLLWYDHRLPSYQNQLRADPNYVIWMLGSSPMMTAWTPVQIQDSLREAGHADVTVQNYGFTTLTNFQVMAQLVENRLLELDQPQYIVLGVAPINFSQNAIRRMRIEDSQLENILIYPDNIDDHANRFLYTTSVLYRYLILSRHAFSIPIENTIRDPLTSGGYTERDGTLVCVETENEDVEATNLERGDLQDHFQINLSALDVMIDLAQVRGIPILVASLPIARCQLEKNYGSVESYQQRYLNPLAEHLRQRGVAFVELDTQFYQRIAPDEQDTYFDDVTHPNKRGARILSRWLSKALDTWLSHEPGVFNG
jgi:lysophospholipase L1-like esterase